MDAENRWVTVMFCDVVESTAMSEALDPEDLLEVLHTYQSTCQKIIERHGGYIAQYLGDGILVYFGYPQAHDDDIQRSVRCAIEILRELKPSGDEDDPTAPLVRTRIGIHTGPVVVGALTPGSGELLAMGAVPNIAARLQALAEPDSIVVSGEIHRLVEGFFRWKELGEFTLKGTAQPMAVFEPLEETGVRTPFELAIQKGLNPMVGRELELDSLRHQYLAAQSGAGQIVQMFGDAGIGKSRLLHAIREDAISKDAIWLLGRCTAQSQNTAFYPILEVLRILLTFAVDDSNEVRRKKLDDALSKDTDSELKELLAVLLGIQDEESQPPVLSPELARTKTMEAVEHLLVRTSQRSPLGIIIEDLHWIDPSSLELLERMLDTISRNRILLLLSYRPSATPLVSDARHVSEIRLAPLTDESTRELITSIAGQAQVSEALLEKIVRRTDGVPLFVEELVKMFMEAGATEQSSPEDLLSRLAIPLSLESLYRSKLDRLDSAKDVIQLASVVGREFTHSMMQNLGAFDDATLDSALDTLVKAELLIRSRLWTETHYSFRHALVQDTVYRSLLRQRRQAYHGLVAETALSRRWPVTIDQPEFVAHHFTEAGKTEEAVDAWLAAGRQAFDRAANAEAVVHFNRGLGVVAELSDEPRWQRELSLSLGLGPALTAARGYGAPGVEETYTRALELCDQLGDAPERFWVLWGLGAYYQARGQHQEALLKGQELQQLAALQRELQAEAQFGVGSSLFYLGQLNEARNELEKGAAFFTNQIAEQNMSPSGHHAGVMSLGYLAIVLWHLGFPDQAVHRANQGIRLSDQIGHPFVRLQSRHWASFVHYLRGDWAELRQAAEAESVLSREFGFPFGELSSAMTLDWLSVMEGDSGGIERLRGRIDAYREVGARVALTYYLTKLADACRVIASMRASRHARKECAKLQPPVNMPGRQSFTDFAATCQPTPSRRRPSGSISRPSRWRVIREPAACSCGRR